jgi:hypothetical protein
MSLSDECLDEIEARLKAATPGCWNAVPIMLACPNETSGGGASTGYVINGPPQRIEDTILSRRWFERREDAVLISNAPTDLADLLAEVHRLRALPQKWPDVQKAVDNLATIYLARTEKAEFERNAAVDALDGEQGLIERAEKAERERNEAHAALIAAARKFVAEDMEGVRLLLCDTEARTHASRELRALHEERAQAQAAACALRKALQDVLRPFSGYTMLTNSSPFEKAVKIRDAALAKD